MSTGFSPPDSSGSLSSSTSSQTDRPMPQGRAMTMTTVVERSSRHPSRESSGSSSETGARNRSRKKSQQRAVASSPHARDVSGPGFLPGMSEDDEMVGQRP